MKAKSTSLPPRKGKRRSGRSLATSSESPTASKVKGTASDPSRLIPDEDRVGSNPALLAEEYNKVARAAALRQILLTQADFEMEPAFIATRVSEASANFKYSFSYAIKNAVYKEDTGLASCEYVWAVTVRDGGKKKALSIATRYYVLYDGIKGCDSDAVSLYLRRVARFATYPYFRAHVSQVSWESGANLPILPAIST